MFTTQANPELHQGIRFSEDTEEIEPAQRLEHVETTTEHSKRDNISLEAQQELLALPVTMQMRNSRLQATRMENFAFEPVSLPNSRVSTSQALAFFVQTFTLII